MCIGGMQQRLRMVALNGCRFVLGGAPPKLSKFQVSKHEGAQALQDDDNIQLEIDVKWESRQDVEIDVSPIPGEIDIQIRIKAT